ncbi:MAG: hypothetical protein KAS12_02675 [Candidatus Aenigmarchaeota archaeon]|nr:hypothetical protein [Candidatus Aenigmarchaeota archaeon]
MDKNTTLAEILKHSQANKILAKYHLPCLFCPMAQYEISKLTIGEVAEMYHLNLTGMLKELNLLISKSIDKQRSKPGFKSRRSSSPRIVRKINK